MIQVIETKECLWEIKEIWNTLYMQSVDATPFQQFDYIWSSLNHFYVQPELRIVMVKDAQINTWIAIFPFIRNRKGGLEFINSAHSDFCLPLIEPEHEHYGLFKELAEWIHSDSKNRGLILNNIPADSKLLSVLQPHFRYAIVHDCNYYSVLPIYKKQGDKDSIDAFRYIQSERKRKHRKTLRSTIETCDFKILSKNNGDKYPSSEIKELTSSMMKGGIRSSGYFSANMLSFWEELYDNGLLTIAMILENSSVRSANFMFYDEKKNEYIKWIMLYGDNTWNMKINLLLAKHLYENGGANINFARGIYDYKLVNFHPDVKPLFRLMIATTKMGHIKNLCSLAFHYSKPVIKLY